MERQEILNLSFLAGKWPLDSSKPNLVFIHGEGATALSWILQIKALSDKINIIAPDLPGHGKSKGPGITNITDNAKRVAELLDALGISSCILVGTSMGGAIAQQLLIDYSNRLSAGILINTGAKLKVIPAIIEAIKTDFKAFMIGMSDFLFPAASARKAFDPSFKDILEINPKIVLNDYLACDSFDIRRRLHEINLPVLVISSKNDIMTPVWFGEYLAKNIQNARLIIIEGAGHLAPFEKPEAVNAAIQDFIESIG